MAIQIRTLAHRKEFTKDSLLAEHDGPVIACDFYVNGAELGREIPGGYDLGAVINVDHHAPSRRMMQNVSSTNLAIEQIREHGPSPRNAIVVVSHTDCDSVLSSCIMAGELEPEDRFGQAAIAADHTGAPNGIADVLQSLDEKRDLYFSLRNLRKLLDGQPIDRTAQPYYYKRLEKRLAANQAVARNSVTVNNSLAFGVLQQRIDGEFFPAILPQAALILLMTRRKDSTHWDAKMRLGRRAPIGASLHDLRIECFDPAFGSRWNAGSNARNGGTPIDPQNYAARVAQQMRDIWDRLD